MHAAGVDEFPEHLPQYSAITRAGVTFLAGVWLLTASSSGKPMFAKLSC